MRTSKLFLLLSTMLFANAIQAEEAQAKSLISVVKAYYQVMEDARQSQAKAEDVEGMASLLTDDFRYQHPRFGADSDKRELIEGMVSVMPVHRNAKIVVLQYIEGKDAVFVEVDSEAEVKQGQGWRKVSGPETALFEFRQGKISRVQEYW